MREEVSVVWNSEHNGNMKEVFALYKVPIVEVVDKVFSGKGVEVKERK